MRQQSEVLELLIDEHDYKIVAEIGVWRSTTALHLLNNMDLDEYWAIDPWVPYTAIGRNSSQRRLNNFHRFACQQMIHFPQLRVMRLPSLVAASMFPDCYFDLVFIDGDHHYEHVLADIGAWSPKVRSGGLLTGHDYDTRRFVDVIRAVKDSFGEQGDDFRVMKDASGGVWIREM